MSRVLVVYHSAHGDIGQMAGAVADGAREALAEVEIKRVPELAPAGLGSASGCRLDQTAPVATVAELPDYDAIIVGVGMRDGRMAPQMASFLAQTRTFWANGALVGRVGSAFTSAGQQRTLMSVHANLMDLGMVAVGLPSSFAGQPRLDKIDGRSPYGATAITGHGRQPSALELAGARSQGRHVAQIANRLFPVATLGETEQTEHFMLGR